MDQPGFFLFLIFDEMKPVKKPLTLFVGLFRIGDRFDIGLMILFFLINGIVFVNACLHDPTIGYDADGHLAYIQSFSQFHLVTPQDTKEFFSPPLPYVIPSLAIALTGVKLFWAAKLAQFMNGFLSIGLTLYMIKTCQLISTRPSLKREALIFLGILPGYYKTFAFVRGEPYVVFFAVVILYYTLLIVINKQFTAINTIILGVTMGLCALSRQWGILLFPAVFILLGLQWIRHSQLRSTILKTIGMCFLLITIISGWFYVSLYTRYGSITAFNWEYNARFSFKNQPLEFYFGLSPRLLFSNPVRPNFPDQFMPILYSELWGDYWGYFTVYGINTDKSKFVDGSTVSKFFLEGRIPHWLETNYTTIGSYLGHVNLVSVFPSILVISAGVNAVRVIFKNRLKGPINPSQRQIYAFVLFAIVSTVVCYYGFCIKYANVGKGGTIKISYVMQVFPFIAVLVAMFLERVNQKSPFLRRLVLFGLLCCFIYNFPAMITHYNWFRLH